MPTYPQSPQITIDALLRQPRLIARDLTTLARKRFVADRILAQGSPESVAGGSVQYQESESIYPDRDPEEVGVRAGFPRAQWAEALKTEVVRKYGLEVPIADETVRRHQMDQFERAERKLSNAVVKFVDTKAMTMLTTHTGRQTFAASGDWTTAATDIILDISEAIRLLATQDEGYEDASLTMIVNWAQWKDLVNDADIRAAMPRETADSTVRTGRAPTLMGLEQILPTNTLAAGNVLIVATKIVGTIADEQPAPSERYATFATGEGPSVWVKTYREEDTDETIVRGARFPAMWVSEPKAIVHITGA